LASGLSTRPLRLLYKQKAEIKKANAERPESMREKLDWKVVPS
jgi:hypothetical protein